MTIEAPVSKYTKSNLKIYILFCVIFAAIFAYDGYLSKYEWSQRRSFYDKHVKDGKPSDTMIFNRYAPIFLLAAAGIFAARFRSIKDKKLSVDEDKLVISENEQILYDSIQKIDRTHFSSKGYFVITYKDKQGNEIDRKLSDRTYDNLEAILEHLAGKIS
jgi:hypothetical protein